MRRVSRSSSKANAGQMRNFEVYSVQKSPKLTKCETQIIEFSDDDYAGVSIPHTDTLVLTLDIANDKIRRILIDTRSSTDIQYKIAFEPMKIDQGKIVPTRQSLVGFSREQVFPFGFIELQVMAGTYSRKKNLGKVHGDKSTLRLQCHPREDGNE